MPTVPVYGGPQLQNAPLQGGFQQANVSEQAFTGAGRQTKALAGALGDVAEGLDKAFDRKAADDAFRVETGIKGEYLQFEAELRRKRGKDAEGLTEQAAKWWDAARERATKDLDPRALSIVSKSLSQARLSGLAGVTRYQEQELDRAFTESTVANIGVEIERTAQSGDPAQTAGARAIIQRNVGTLAARNGWDANQTALETQRYTSVMHQRMLDTLVDTSPEAAKAYFEANKAEIDSARLKPIEKAIKGAVTERSAETFAASVAALPYEQQLVKAGEIKDSDARQASIKRVRENQEDITKATAAREKQVSDQVWQQVANGVPLNKLPKALLEKMDGKERVQVNAHYEAERKRQLAEAKGNAVKTDYAEYERLLTLPPEEFLKTRITASQDKLARGDLEKLIDKQAQMRNNPKTEKDTVTWNNKVTARIETMGLLGEKPQEKRGAFRSQAQTEFEKAVERNGGKPLKPVEEDEILDRLTIQQKTGWFSTKRAFEIPPEKRGEFKPATPQGQALIDRDKIRVEIDPYRAQISNALRQQGKPVNEATVSQTYLFMKQNNLLPK